MKDDGSEDIVDEDPLRAWSDKVAGLGVDMLIDYGLIKREDEERAMLIVGEEIWARLAMGDYPPPQK